MGQLEIRTNEGEITIHLMGYNICFTFNDRRNEKIC